MNAKETERDDVAAPGWRAVARTVAARDSAPVENNGHIEAVFRMREDLR